MSIFQGYCVFEDCLQCLCVFMFAADAAGLKENSRKKRGPGEHNTTSVITLTAQQNVQYYAYMGHYQCHETMHKWTKQPSMRSCPLLEAHIKAVLLVQANLAHLVNHADQGFYRPFSNCWHGFAVKWLNQSSSIIYIRNGYILLFEWLFLLPPHAVWPSYTNIYRPSEATRIAR